MRIFNVLKLSLISTLLLCLSLTLSSSLSAKVVKIGVLAPDGTSWAQNLKDMAKEIKTTTKGKVKFKIYYGGSQGDEPEVLRKIRIGQLHGGFFTGKTLGEINGDVRVMEIPFTFHGNGALAKKTLGKLAPFFNKKFQENEFINLGFFEIGQVYLVSKKKILSLKDLNGLKIWSWEGDLLASALIKTMNLVSVPLPLPDVLSSLSTGIVEAAYSPPLAILALQWNTKVKYFLNFPITFSIGAFLVSQKAWNKISPQHRDMVEKISRKYLVKISAANALENSDAKEILKSMGIQIINFPDEDYQKGSAYRKAIITKLKGKLFSTKALEKLEAEL